MKNKMEDLRNHLFATLEGLLDRDKPLDVEVAKTVAKTASVLIDSAKVEVEYLKITGGKGSGFIPEQIEPPKRPQLTRAK